MRALVLGASGFLGCNLSAKLIDKGAKVRGVARSIRYREPLRGVDFIEMDLGPRASLSRLLGDVDVVFNLTGSSSLQRSEQDRHADLRQTVGGMWNLLEACLDAGVKRVVYASSGGTVYGLQEGEAIEETAAPRPISAYGVHKLAAEHCMSLFNQQYGMQNVALRIANPFGPYQRGDDGQGIVSIFGRSILSSEPITLMDHGSMLRDFIYVEDVCDALIAAAEYDGDHHVFNIGTGHSRSVLEILRTLETALCQTAIVLHVSRRSFDVPTNLLDVKRAAHKLGWRSKISCKAGILKTAEWLKAEYLQSPKKI